MEEIRGKTLKEWKDYCKSDNVPIMTMKYITVLEERIEQLTIPVVGISVDDANKYGRHQYNRGNLDLKLIDFDSWKH